MRFRFLEKMTTKAVQTASIAAKDEVKQSAINLIPKLLGLAATGLGIFIFKEAVIPTPEVPKPSMSTSKTTTYNYFFQTLSEESIKKIMEGK